MKFNGMLFLLLSAILVSSLQAAGHGHSGLSDADFEKLLAAGTFGRADDVVAASKQPPLALTDASFNRRLANGEFGRADSFSEDEDVLVKIKAEQAAAPQRATAPLAEEVEKALMRKFSLKKIIETTRFPSSSLFISLSENEQVEVQKAFKRDLIQDYYHKLQDVRRVEEELRYYVHDLVHDLEVREDLVNSLENETKKYLTRDKNLIFLNGSSEQKYQEADYVAPIDQAVFLGFDYRQIAVPYQPDNLCSYYSLYNALCLKINDEAGLSSGMHRHESGIFAEGQSQENRRSLETFISACKRQENIPGRDGIWEHAEGLIALIERHELGLRALRNPIRHNAEDAFLNNRLAPNVTIINDWRGIFKGVFQQDRAGNIQEDVCNLIPFEGEQLVANIERFKRAGEAQIILLNLGNHWITLKLEKQRSGIPLATVTDSLGDLHVNNLVVAAVIAVFMGDKQLAKEVFESLKR